jgi:hypothetical protein
MAGIKTGNKGFVNPADQNKVYTMDSVAPGQNKGANENPPDLDPGNMTVDNTIKDISKKTRITLGTYLSKVTKGEVGSSTKPNKYIVDASTDASLPSAITTGGYPTPLGTSDNSSQFNKVLPSSFSPDYASIAGGIKKGRSAAQLPDGNEILRNATAGNTSTQLVPNTPVDKYTAAVIADNRWDPQNEFTGGEDPSNPSAGFEVKLQSNAEFVMPSGEATKFPSAEYELGLAEAQAKVIEVSAQNDQIVATSDKQFIKASHTTQGVPTPLSQPADVGEGAFAPNVKNSYNEEDYVRLNVGAADGLQKGKTSAEGPSGHDFLPGAQVAGGVLKGPKPLVDYTDAAVRPNRLVPGVNSFTNGEDPSSPPKDFNAILQSEAIPGLPGEEVTTSSKYELDLGALTKKPVADTVAAKNAYPVSKPDITDLDSISSADGKYPAPLTPAVNVNSTVHAEKVTDSMSDAYPMVANLIKKGKSNESGKDGNELLTKGVTTNAQGKTKLDPVLNVYTETTLKKNDQKPSKPLIPSEIDPTAPPANYHPYLADVSTPGSHTGAPHDQLTLNELRGLPVAATQRNSFPIDKNTYALDSTTTQGIPTPLANSQNDDRFVNDKVNINPPSSDASVTNFKKGKGPADSKYDGHNLLKEIDGNLSTGRNSDKYAKQIVPIVGKGTVDLATSKGNPSPDKTPADHPIKTYKGDRGSTLSLGNNRFAPHVGLDAKIPGFNPTLKLSDGKSITTMEMAQIGAGLSQRASAEIPGYLQGKFDPNGNIAEIAAQLPSVVQTGILKVDNVILEAKDMLNSLEGSFPTRSLTEIAPFGDQSWGVMNNVSEPFDDPTNIGLMITMILMMIAIRLLLELFALPTNFTGSVTKKQSPTGQRVLGSYMYTEPSGLFSLFPFDVYEIFGFKRTINRFIDCLRAGFNAFFLGSGNADVGLGELAFGALGIGLDSLVGEGQAVGYNLGVCRTIIRFGLVLAQALDRVIRSPNIVAGIKSAVGILRIIRSSKFIASFNVFTSLGDTLIERSKQSAIEGLTGPDGNPLTIAAIDAAEPNKLLNSTVLKNRLSSAGAYAYNPTLAWSAQRAPSLYLVSSNVYSLQRADTINGNKLESFKGGRALPVYYNSADPTSTVSREYHASGNGARIPNDIRKKLEDALDAEYVPFSFHDVRTNEIVSFHAFLNSLTDDYNAQYDSVDGFGRIEPVKIYKGTTRRIGMSFVVASTSDNDFDRMWVKINKLLTMIYPQYTRGRDLLGENYRFVAPFSQLIGASPLVRIRLGDLFRSNYSRFSLARLFGMADGNAEFPDADGNPAKINLENQVFTQEKEKEYQEKAKIFTGGEEVEILDENIENEIYEVAKSLIIPNVEIKQDESGNEINRLFTTPPITYKVESRLLSTDFYNVQAYARDSIIEGSEKTISAKHLKKTDAKLKETAQEVFGSSVTSLQKGFDAVANFMNPDNNAITKSFESAGGKGLAGFIESMQFDWLNQTTWSVDLGRTAPKMCKVTISFSPIHDITPGIDHMGYNRAPVYPVGAAMVNSKEKTE